MYWYRITVETSCPSRSHVFTRQFSGRSEARAFASAFLGRLSSPCYLDVSYLHYVPAFGTFYPRASVFTFSSL